MTGQVMPSNAAEDGATATGEGSHSLLSRLADKVGDKVKVALSAMSIHKEKAKASLLDMSAPIRHNMLINFRDVVKSQSLHDPDMPRSLAKFLRDVLDQVWEDIEMEVEAKLEAALLKQYQDESEPGPTGHWPILGSWWRKSRAFVLHHYLPHNRSLFGKLKDPVYLAIMFLILLPVHGLRVAFFSLVLLFLLFPGPPDQFQLFNYVLLFKGTQFLTSGLITTMLGALQYFRCYSLDKENLLLCIDQSGPGASDLLGTLVDYFGSVALVWTAFSLLPWSKPLAARTYVARGPDDCDSRKAAGQESDGGRMRQLLVYDVRCFAISMAILTALTLATCNVDFLSSRRFHDFLKDPQLRANIYWCKVLYSLSSFPFTFFTIPVFLQVLTHTTPTGFNENGACVQFALPQGKTAAKPRKRQKVQQAFEKTTGRWKGTIEELISAGAANRGAQDGTGSRFADFNRGLWLKLRSGRVHHSELVEEAPDEEIWLSLYEESEDFCEEDAHGDHSQECRRNFQEQLKEILAKGEAARRAEGQGAEGYQFGDFTRGLVAVLRGPHTEEPASGQRAAPSEAGRGKLRQDPEAFASGSAAKNVTPEGSLEGRQDEERGEALPIHAAASSHGGTSHRHDLRDHMRQVVAHGGAVRRAAGSNQKEGYHFGDFTRGVIAGLRPSAPASAANNNAPREEDAGTSSVDNRR